MTQKPQSVPLTDFLYNKAGFHKLPLSGAFELTPMCNLSCRMCYVRKTAKEVADAPRPMLTASKWLDIARHAKEAGMLFLLLTGGEPLMHPDFWPLYEQLIHMGFLISINTNGTLLNADAAARFRALPPRRVSVTLYGASDDTYERLCGTKGMFQRVTQAIDLLRDAQVNVKINCSLTPDNAADLPAIVEFARSRELRLDAVSYMFPPVRRDNAADYRRFCPTDAAFYRLENQRLQNTPQMHRAYLEHICMGHSAPHAPEEGCVDPTDGKFRCRAGTAAFWITWDGWMTPCGMLSEPKQDLRGLNFSQSWSALTQSCEDLTLPMTCAQCGSRELCHPCPAMAYAETGSHKGVPPYLCKTTAELRRLAEQTLAEYPCHSV